MSNESIDSIVSKIRKSYLEKKETKDQLKVRWSEFSESKPLLFNMICSEDCHPDVLRDVLKTINRFSSGELTQEKASEIFGGTLVDKYVKPVLK
jgi:hypothetical protein